MDRRGQLRPEEDLWRNHTVKLWDMGSLGFSILDEITSIVAVLEFGMISSLSRPEIRSS